jgi:hypothetical protein
MNGPRITPLDIEQNIREEFYFTAYEGAAFEISMPCHDKTSLMDAAQRMQQLPQ